MCIDYQRKSEVKIVELKICDKAEDCKSSCWHKTEHEPIPECKEDVCPANPAAHCIDAHPVEAPA